MPAFDSVAVSDCNPSCPFLNPDTGSGTSCGHYRATNATAIPETGVPTWCPLLVRATAVHYEAPPP